MVKMANLQRDCKSSGTIRPCQHVSLAKPSLIWIYVLSLIFTHYGQTFAFLPSASSITQLTRDDKKSSIFTPSIHKKRSLLHMVAKSGGRAISSTEQFEKEVITNNPENKLTLVLFTAPWCGPCRLTNPVVKEIMKQYTSKLEVVEINTDDLPEVASNAGVTSIPTIQIYHGGNVKDTIVGCVSKNVLGKAVDKVLEDVGLLVGGEEKQDHDTDKESS